MVHTSSDPIPDTSLIHAEWYFTEDTAGTLASMVDGDTLAAVGSDGRADIHPDASVWELGAGSAGAARSYLDRFLPFNSFSHYIPDCDRLRVNAFKFNHALLPELLWDFMIHRPTANLTNG